MVVCTYSSIFIATPAVIWLNDKLVASQRAGAGAGMIRAPRTGSQESLEI